MNCSKTRNIFVQLLPVIKQQSDSINSIGNRNGKVLLCKWKDGQFKERFTGMIKAMDFKAQDFPTDLSLRSRLELEARAILPKGLLNEESQDMDINLVAILEFKDAPACDEYVYVVNFKDTADADHLKDISFDGNPCHWFNWDKIPFQEMPADDPIWYPKVLQQGLKVTGNFVFGGWNEKTLKSFEVNTVPHF